MSDFFAFPTVNSWDEDVFQLTTAGIITVLVLMAALIAIAVLTSALKRSDRKTRKVSAAKQLAFSGAAMALALIASEFLKFARLPMGGSVTFFSMLFVVLIGYWYGLRAGLLTAFAYGLLQFIINPVFYSPMQLLVDYPLAFGALGLSGIFSDKKHGLFFGYLTGVIGRYFFATLSGVLFFAHYAPEGQTPLAYSLGYQATYIVPEAVITLIVIAVPAVSKGLAQVKKLATE